MMEGAWPGLAVALLLSAVHLFSPEVSPNGRLSGRRWLSFAGGVSAGYVFLHILPDLAQRQALLSGSGIIFLADREVFLMALCGLVGFYALEHLARRSLPDLKEPSGSKRKISFGLWLHAISFALYSAIVGYLLSQISHKPTLTLTGFAISFGLHFFVNDQSLRRHYGDFHNSNVRWVLAGSVPLGWLAGMLLPISDHHVTIVYAFLAGGMILNILKDELPAERQGAVGSFFLGVVLFAMIGLLIEIEG